MPSEGPKAGASSCLPTQTYHLQNQSSPPSLKKVDTAGIEKGSPGMIWKSFSCYYKKLFGNMDKGIVPKHLGLLKLGKWCKIRKTLIYIFNLILQIDKVPYKMRKRKDAS